MGKPEANSVSGGSLEPLGLDAPGFSGYCEPSLNWNHQILRLLWDFARNSEGSPKMFPSLKMNRRLLLATAETYKRDLGTLKLSQLWVEIPSPKYLFIGSLGP